MTDARATFFRSPTQVAGARVSIDFRHFVSHPVWRGLAPDAVPLLSWATFRSDSRSLENVVDVTAIALDVVAPLPSLDALAASTAAALPVEWHFYTSLSSAPGACRAIGRLSRPMTGEEHSLVWAIIESLLERQGVKVDAAAMDPSRAHPVPAVPPNGVYEWRSTKGEPLDVDAFLEAARELAEADEVERAAKVAQRAPLWTAPGLSVLFRARRYVDAVPGPNEGEGEAEAARRLANRLVGGFGLSEVQALQLMATWAARCALRSSREDLARTVREARGPGRKGAGEQLDRRTA